MAEPAPALSDDSLAGGAALSKRVLLISGLLSLLSILMVSLPFVPLGVPGEWLWERADFNAETTFSVILGGMFLAGYFAFGFLSESWLARRSASKRDSAIAITGLVIFSFFFLLMIRSVIPNIDGLARGAWVLYYPRMSGYYTQARTSGDSTGEFLAGYADVMRQGDYLHQGTHPPGLVLFHRALLWVCETAVVQSILKATEPASVAEALDILTQQSIPAEGMTSTMPEVTPRDRASLWLGDLLTTFSVAMTPVPLWFLLRRHGQSPSMVLQTLLFWPLMANVIMFLPKSDCLYPLMSMSIVVAWAFSDQSLKRVLGFGFVTGLLSGVSMMTTLAFAPVLVMLGVMTLLRVFTARHVAHELLAITAAALGLLVTPAVLWAMSGANLFEIWVLNFQNHGKFYDHNTRTYFLWLIANIMDWGMFSAVVVATLALTGLANVLQSVERRDAMKLPLVQVSVAYAVVMLLLWLWGKNMGEAARLWIIYDPLLLMTAGLGIAAVGPSRVVWRTLLVMQAVSTLVIVIRVNGFHLGDL